MEDSTKESQLKELASQLRNPHSSTGTEIADMMHATNIGMTKNAIHAMDLQNNDAVLELGHGNAAHLFFLLEQAKDLKYTGLDISELMQQEASKLNQPLASMYSILFQLYDGLNIPFKKDVFDKVFTVNTIYFWEKPIDLLNEIYRIMKPGGIFCITYAQKSFMEKLPFTVYGFQLYDKPSIEALIAQTPFIITNSETITEQVKTKTGEMVDRDYTTVTLKK